MKGLYIFLGIVVVGLLMWVAYSHGKLHGIQVTAWLFNRSNVAKNDQAAGQQKTNVAPGEPGVNSIEYNLFGTDLLTHLQTA